MYYSSLSLYSSLFLFIHLSLAWIVGIVEKGDRNARIIDKPRIIDVPAVEKDNNELW